MADKEQTEDGATPAEPARKSKRKLLIMAALAVVVLGGAGGGWFMFMRPHAEPKVEAALPKPPTFVEVPEILVNLAGVPGDRVQYLKVKVVLEVKDAPQVALITPTMPRITDILQTYLRELRPNDLNGSVGMFRLKEELTRRVNLVVAPTQVNAVLFKEIFIQ
jgi:flagellar FliL protein